MSALRLFCGRQAVRPRQLNRPISEIPPEQSLKGELALGDRPMTEYESTDTPPAIAERDAQDAEFFREMSEEEGEW